MTDSSFRSITKTVSWRVVGTTATFAIGYAIIGDLQTSGTIALIQLTINTVLYFVHERVWNKLSWGQK